MASYFVSWTFRFRGKADRLLAIVECFLNKPNKGLSPTQVGRECGIAMYDVVRILDQTPELFVKLPGRGDGITRYRLASSVTARGEEGIEALIRHNARRESWLYYGLLTIVLLFATVAVLAILPALF